MPRINTKIVLLTVAASLLAACSKDSAEPAGGSASADGLLKYVPADTPYLFATTAKAPDDVYDKLEPQLDAMLQIYPAMIKSVLQTMIEAGEEGTDVDALSEALPLVDELDSLMTIEGLREAGIDRDSMYVFYGAGLLPVLRISLTDGQLMEAAVARLEESAATKMSVASIDNVEYRYAGDKNGRIIVAVIGNELVVTVAPSELSEANLKTVLGLSLPDRNIVDAGTIREVYAKYGFSDYMVAIVDFQRLSSVFLDEPAGINAEILSIANYDPTAMSAACKADARSLASVMPRLVAGYTEISVEQLVSSAVVELRPDLASGLSTLTGAVPGLGNEQGGIFSMGMSANLLAAREYYAERLDALENDPYECAELADLQAGVAAGRAALEQPVPPIVYGFSGFLAVVENIEGLDIQNQRPPTSIDMRLLLAMENAEGLLAMGAMFSPELASLNIEPDGKPVKLEIGQIAALGQTVHLAMTDSAVALSVGEGPEARLGAMLQARVNEPAPFLSFDMDAARYYSFIGEAMMADPDGGAATPEMRESMQAMISAIQQSIDRMSFAVHFTANGIALKSTVKLAE